MGIYDEGGLRERLFWIFSVALFLVLVWLYLPPPLHIVVSADTQTVRPGGEVILWVTVRNGTNTPLSGLSVAADATSPHLTVDVGEIPTDVPPGGEVTAKVTVGVGESAVPGDHLVRVFVSLPGRTEVFHVRVRVV